MVRAMSPTRALFASLLVFVLASLACAGRRGALPAHPAAANAADPAPPPATSTTASAAGEEARDLGFLRDLAATRSFALGRPTGVHPLPDGSKVLFLRSEPRRARQHLYTFDVASGAVRELITAEDVLKGAAEQLSPEERARRERMRLHTSGFASYELTHDGSALLTSLGGHVFLVQLDGGSAHEVARPDEQGAAPFDPRPSPDGRRLAFVRAGELWVAPTSGVGRETRLSRGTNDVVTHGQAEFVAQEEMNRWHGFWWSPDSQRLVYQESDASHVDKLYLGDPADPTQKVVPTAYPRPGRPNVDVRLGIVAASGGSTTWIDWDQKRYPYLADVVWEEHAPLTIVVESRDQRELSLRAVDPRTGRTSELLHEHDDVFLNLGGDYRWLPDGSAFLWSSERGGGWQLELHDREGGLVRTLTPTSLGLLGLRHVGLEGDQAIVCASTDAIDRQLYAVRLTGGAPRALSRGPQSHDAVFARSGHVQVVQSFGLDGEQWEVRRADGSLAGLLPSVAEQPPSRPRVEILRVGESPAVVAALVRPHDFDPRRRYPVLVDVYGGPGVQTVTPSARRYLLSQWVADHGFIVALIDGRGTPHHGRDWERAIRGRFAELPLGEQVRGLAALAKREPAMDLARVGIYGHSFGGYLAALAVMRRPDIFRAAVASAPVVDWLDYDTHYTERYLGVPRAGDGATAAAYETNGLLHYAAGLTRPLLIIHGTADDNVHFDQSLKLADALFRAGRAFQLTPLLGQTHAFHEPQLSFRYWQRLFAFFRQTL
jgi:dipeptidyl-peptidase-4